MGAIRNLRKCAYNPATRKNEETFLLKSGKVVFSSSITKSTSDIDEKRFRVNKYVSEDDVMSSRICCKPTGNVEMRNKTKCMEFGADKDASEPYRYDTHTTNTTSVLDAWKANKTYLSASTGVNHAVREVIVLDIDNDLYENIPEGFFGLNGSTRKGMEDFVEENIKRKIREITSMGIPAPNAVSLHTTNAHYQMHWYLTDPIQKTTYNLVNNTCTSEDAKTPYAETYIPLTRMLNILFGGDDSFTGWRCRNTFCTHLDGYKNFKVEGDELIPTTDDTEYGKYDTSEIFKRIFGVVIRAGMWECAASNLNADIKRSKVKTNALMSKWYNTRRLLIEIGKAYSVKADSKTECAAVQDDAPTENEEPQTEDIFKADEYTETEETKQRGATRRNTKKSEYTTDFKIIKKLYKTDKIGALTEAYINMNIGRNGYWMSSPLLLRELEPNISKQNAYAILRAAYDVILKKHGGVMLGTTTAGSFSNAEIRRTFEYGWKNAMTKEIYMTWTDEQRQRSAETNSTKYKFRKIQMYNYLIKSKIDIEGGINKTIVEKMSVMLGVNIATIRRMMKECDIKPCKSKRYKVCKMTKLTKNQKRIYKGLCAEVQTHLNNSNAGKDYSKHTFGTKVLSSSKSFCNDRNYNLCQVDNMLDEKVHRFLNIDGSFLSDENWHTYMHPEANSDPPDDE